MKKIKNLIQGMGSVDEAEGETHFASLSKNTLSKKTGTEVEDRESTNEYEDSERDRYGCSTLADACLPAPLPSPLLSVAHLRSLSLPSSTSELSDVPSGSSIGESREQSDQEDTVMGGQMDDHLSSQEKQQGVGELDVVVESTGTGIGLALNALPTREAIQTTSANPLEATAYDTPDTTCTTTAPTDASTKDPKKRKREDSTLDPGAKRRKTDTSTATKEQPMMKTTTGDKPPNRPLSSSKEQQPTMHHPATQQQQATDLASKRMWLHYQQQERDNNNILKLTIYNLIRNAAVGTKEQPGREGTTNAILQLLATLNGPHEFKSEFIHSLSKMALSFKNYTLHQRLTEFLSTRSARAETTEL
jgi:hypothetical protein